MKQFDRKILYAILTAVFVLFSFGDSKAQNTAPTPTPLVKDDLKPVKDKQDVRPEKLKGVPPIARGYESKDRDLPDLGRVGVDMMSQKPLALREAIVKALENNIDIEVTRQDVKIAEFDLKAAGGSYEPRITGQTFYERATTPNISIFSSNQTTTSDSLVGNIRYEASIKEFGTKYYAEVDNQRLGTNNTISILSPQNNTSFTVGIVQPLMRGRKNDNQRRLIEIARKNLSLTDTQFRQKAIEITANVQRAYWDLTFALKNLQVQRDGVRDAKEQLAHNKRLVAEGVLAPIGVVAAETQVANLEQSVYAALETVNRAENILKSYIAKNRNDILWSDAIVPTDPVALKIPKISLTEALNSALENRPELESNEVAAKINEIDREFYKEQNRPKVDLTASYSSTGISGKFNRNFETPFQPSECQSDPAAAVCLAAIAEQNARIIESAQAFTGGTQSTFTDILLNRYPTYRIGVQIDLPLFGNRTTKANLGKTLVQADKLRFQKDRIEQVIQMDVRNAMQSLRTAEARLRAAAISRENSEKQYESEKRKLDAGLSDIYKVLERQTAFVKARSLEVQSQIELNKSIAELQKATGNSLKANEVETRLRK
ncbi:MAG: TolC family protein [Pyrinomonadaceae bacterium]|nr:TolC family protein [Pyrinomonadaceae bacterium]